MISDIKETFFHKINEEVIKFNELLDQKQILSIWLHVSLHLDILNFNTSDRLKVQMGFFALRNFSLILCH